MLNEAELTDFSSAVISLWQEFRSAHPIHAGEQARQFIEENVGRLYDRGWEGQFDRHKSVSPLLNTAYVRADLAEALGDVAVRLVWLTVRPRQSNMDTARHACERYLQLAEVELPDAENPEGEEQPNGPESNAPATKITPPSDDATACYRAIFLTGMRQIPLAERMTVELQRPISQGQVSRWIKQVEKWIAAGNVLPNRPSAKPAKSAAMDPRTLDLGARQDGHTPRQRDKRSEDSDD